MQFGLLFVVGAAGAAEFVIAGKIQSMYSFLVHAVQVLLSGSWIKRWRTTGSKINWVTQFPPKDQEIFLQNAARRPPLAKTAQLL